MKKNSKKIIVIIISILITLILVGVLIGLLTKKGYRTIMVEEINGTAVLARPGKDEVQLWEGKNLISEDNVKTGNESGLVLLIDTDKHVGANENTEFVIVSNGDENQGSINIHLLSGSALFTIDNKLNEESSFNVDTPTATFAVRGTAFLVDYDSENETTRLDVSDGIVHVDAANGESTDVEAGEQLIITTDGILKENARLTAAIKEFWVKDNLIYNGKPFYDYTGKELRALYQIEDYPEEQTPEQILATREGTQFFTGFTQPGDIYDNYYEYVLSENNGMSNVYISGVWVHEGDESEFHSPGSWRWTEGGPNITRFELLDYTEYFGETNSKKFCIENEITSVEKAMDFFGLNDDMLDEMDDTKFLVPDIGTVAVSHRHSESSENLYIIVINPDEQSNLDSLEFSDSNTFGFSLAMSARP